MRSREELYKFLGKRESRSTKQVATKVIKTECGIGIQYHSTVVVEYLDSEGIVLNTGGYETNTTKARMNQYLPYNISIKQSNFNWFIKVDDKTIPFEGRKYIIDNKLIR